MRPCIFIVIAVLLAGCYRSHELRDDTDGAISCMPPSGETFLRDDCTSCNAWHFTWLRRCGDRIHVRSTSGIRATFTADRCGAVHLDACAIRDACVTPATCDGLDVSTFEELLRVRSRLGPRSGAREFEPAGDSPPIGMPPTCDELALDAPSCG
jgi:hypothetical protein